MQVWPSNNNDLKVLNQIKEANALKCNYYIHNLQQYECVYGKFSRNYAWIYPEIIDFGVY